MDDSQNIIGFGPAGQTNPYALVILAQQPSPEGIDLQIVLDDGGLTEYVSFMSSDQRRRRTRPLLYDEARNLRCADLQLTAGSREVLLECIDAQDHRIRDLCCIYNLYTCTFAPAERGEENFVEGTTEAHGAKVTYSKTGRDDRYEQGRKLMAQADQGIFAKLASTLFDVLLMGARCYLGALFVWELGWIKPEHCVVAGCLAGFISNRTLGNTLGILVHSAALKISLIFTPVLGVAYLAIRPDIAERLVFGGGFSEEISLKINRIGWTNPAVLYGVKWSLVIIVALWFVVWIFGGDEAPGEKSKEPRD